LKPERILILGIGNLLAGDEGAGIHAVMRMERAALPGHVTLLDGGTGGFHLLSLFREYPVIILIDAALDGRPPGSVAVRAPRFARDFPPSLSAHDIGLRDLLESAELLGPLPRVHLVTISIEKIPALSLELSDPVSRALPAVERAVFELVEAATSA
jgi:hydrogenase maturation protease